MLTPEQAKFSLHQILVTRALGIEAIVPADIAEYRLEPEEIYLLCSDGLTDRWRGKLYMPSSRKSAMR